MFLAHFQQPGLPNFPTGTAGECSDGSSGAGAWQRLDLVQKDQDVAAKTGVTLGGAAIDAQGAWQGQWTKLDTSTSAQVTVSPASAVIVLFSTNK